MKQTLKLNVGNFCGCMSVLFHSVLRTATTAAKGSPAALPGKIEAKVPQTPPPGPNSSISANPPAARK
eukprot:2510006-Rhodomonas_salina.1